MGAGKNNKHVPSSALPDAAARIPLRLLGVATPGELEDQHPVWRLSLLDREHVGSWSWGIDDSSLVKIVDFLTEMERLTWREVRAQMTSSKRRRGLKHKSIPIAHLCKEAQDRLQELQFDDFEELFRFRTGNMERLWGVISGDSPRVFYPIWWDADHKVCPGMDQN
ncbi:hypothetical protein BGM19_07000 [Streptomyces agglomeratus]|uniref:hypothetical protein n=1 Tax=Streptomyces agglomeratus TaxID=285458 RepID=UPI00086C2D4C|nr:hypothetical protein [Streptomyces agglomeratus]OEJ57752.1 hypothetical protein BGM19_07000 [Streptomyces agglomeratus]